MDCGHRTMKMRFHIVGLPHTLTTKRAPYNACAYTQKVLNFCKMMNGLGHAVYHYGGEGSEVECTEHVNIMSQADHTRFFHDQDWMVSAFDIAWDSKQPYWQVANAAAMAGIARRREKKDFLCLIGGASQKPIADFFGDGLMAVEYGVGYYGTFAKYRVFESYAHMHHCYGQQKHDANGNFYDCVIPNYYDAADFPFSECPQQRLLFVGRGIIRKGLATINAIAKAVKLPVVVAGQGFRKKGDKLMSQDGETMDRSIEHLGFLDTAGRAREMGSSLALLVPTDYIEPFGGVAVESMLTGTGVISTDWGAFTETVSEGVSGFRCRTLQEFVDAVEKCKTLDRAKVRQWALERYTLPVVAEQYDRYFHRLYDLWGKGWYTLKTSA